MTGVASAFATEYESALHAYLEHGAESALSDAYELGRRALAEGRGLLDIAAVHQAAEARLLAAAAPDDREQRAQIAALFLREILAPFEMTFQGYREANEELRRLNQTLLEQKSALESVNQELESFSYSVSHDLRAPLRSIDGFSHILLEDYSDKLDEDGQRSLRRVSEAAQRMAQLIDDLLMLARLTRVELRRSPVDLSAAARAVVDRLRAAEPDRAVEVEVAEPMSCDADPRLVGVLLDNLIGNAWKFTSKREGARIEIGQAERSGRKAYFVKDNGAGFDMAHADKLFGAFQRLHTQREFEGTGIGLATVRRIVHRHGGQAWAESQVDRGATFYFTLGEAASP